MATTLSKARALLRRVRLNGTCPVYYMALGTADKGKVDKSDVSRKRSRVEADTE